MMMPMNMMGGGKGGGYMPVDFGKATKAGKGKGNGKGKGKVGAMMQMCQPSLYDQSAWNPQPAHPCSKCGSKDHIKKWCPYQHHLCEKCGKYGHPGFACRASADLAPCWRCGKHNHTPENCLHKDKVCNLCKQTGHIAAMCTATPAKATTTESTTEEADPEVRWYCPHCRLYCPLKDKKCNKCKRKRPDEPEEEAKKEKPQAKLLNAWEAWTPEQGEMDMSEEDKEICEKKHSLEKSIKHLKKVAGQEAVVKGLEEELKKLQSKKQVHTIEKDCVAVAKSVQDAKEQAARMIGQVKEKLRKKMAEQETLVKNQAAQEKELKEAYERDLLAAKKGFQAAKAVVDAEVEELRSNVEDTEKEAEARVTVAKKAFSNIAAANTGAATATRTTGPSYAEVAALPGVALVPTMPGYILHQNDISPQEMHEQMLTNPLLRGMSAEQAAAITLVSLQLMQEKATYVPPVAEAAVEQPREQHAEEGSNEDDLDPLTSDEEQDELKDVNSKEGDVVEKAPKIRRSANKNRSSGGVVKTTKK